MKTLLYAAIRRKLDFMHKFSFSSSSSSSIKAPLNYEDEDRSLRFAGSLRTRTIIGFAALLRYALCAVALTGAWSSAADLNPNERLFPGDNAVQVWVPGGTFTMGIDDPTQPDRPDERPPHTVTVDGFWMDKYEVTNQQYVDYFNKKMKDKTLRERMTVAEVPILNWPESGITQDPATGDLAVKPGRENYPVLVSWVTAQLYCEGVGKALPSEAQWEWAAKGLEGRRYPWGETWNAKTANIATDKIMAVGSFPKDMTPVGLFDLGGNVREWCGDKYEVDYYKKSAAKNPFNWNATWYPPADRAIRGGGYGVTEWDSRTTSRNFVHNGARGICAGFRCVTGGEPPKGP